jgi:hypothetical protein
MSAPEGKARKRTRRWLFWGIIGGGIFWVIVLSAIFASDTDTSQPRPSTTAATPPERPHVGRVWMADQLVDAYQANEARANAEFQDKWIAVQGYIYSITEREILGGYSVSIEAGGGFTNVICSTEDREWVLGLTKGQLIQAVGIGTGQTLGSPTLKDCGPPVTTE